MPRLTPRERYEEERRQAVARIERLGRDLKVQSLPLETVAAMMPVLPEWQTGRGGRPKGKR